MFAVIGDYGLAGTNEQNVANLVKSWNPNFILTVGDNNYPSGAASTIDPNVGQYYHSYISPYKGSYGPGDTTNQFFATLGNHDYNSTSGFTPYLNYFTMPGNGRYYTLTEGPVEFFVLDSNSQEPDGRTSTSVQGHWLQSQLAASTATWKLVVFHHAPYTSDSQVAPTTVMRWPFQAWGASAVLTGHAHMYERLSEDNNFPYIVDGLGGVSRDSIGTISVGSLVRYNAQFGALRVAATDTQLTFQFIVTTGAVIDTLSLTNSLPAAPSNLSATAISASEIDLSWTNNATNQAGFAIQRSTDGTTFTPLATVGANVTSFKDIGLAVGTQYFYRVQATNPSGSSSFSNVANATTSSGIPAAPSNLLATAVATSEIDLSWTNNATNQTGFLIQRSTDGMTFTQLATVAANVTSFNDTGLAASTQYFYRVQATNANGGSPFSNVASATTSTGIPAAPSNLLATAVSTSEINLSWTNNATNQTGFLIQRSTDGMTFAQLATVAANITSFNDTGLTANTQYFYRVQATNANGGSPFSNVASATTSAGVPAAPSNLLATAVATSEIDLSWTNNATNQTGFLIQRSIDGTTFTQLATVAANVTSFNDTGLTANTQYFYRVQATNANGGSPFSNVASATTATSGGSPAAPSNLVAVVASLNEIDLTWVNNATNQTSIAIQRSLDGTNFTSIATVAAGATSFQDTTVAAKTQYYYRVQAVNASGSSASNVVTTKTATAPAASGIAATAVSASEVDVSWIDNSINETSFKIFRSTDGVNFTPVGIVGANITRFVDHTVSANTLYYYHVRAYNGVASTTGANTASVMTPS
jgi:phosphodiesterase/alkaline phosphatase D-like protein